MKKNKLLYIKIFTLALCSYTLSACVSYDMEQDDFNVLYNAGDFDSASEFYLRTSGRPEPTEKSEQANDTNRMAQKQLSKIDESKALAYLPALNTAVASMDARKYERADKFFVMADEDIKSKNTGDYEPKYYEKIMLSAYNGLNAWQNKDFSVARVEFNRAYSNQQAAIRENKKAIREAEDELRKNDAEKTRNAVSSQLDSLYEYNNFKDLKAYKDFANPYASYLSGLYLVLNQHSSSDVENGINYLKRVNSMMPDNSMVKKDLALAEKIAKGDDYKPRVWIIYEEGLAPALVKETFNVPFYLGAGVKIAKMSLPKIVPSSEPVTPLSVVYGKEKKVENTTVEKDGKTENIRKEVYKDKIVNTEVVADMEKIFATDYYARLPYEITKAVVWMTVNLIAQEALQRADKNSDLGGFGFLAALIVSQISNPVDISTWASLPKSVQIASLDIPDTRYISLKIKEEEIKNKISFKKNTKYAIVYVRKPTYYAKPAVNVVEFK